MSVKIAGLSCGLFIKVGSH